MTISNQKHNKTKTKPKPNRRMTIFLLLLRHLRLHLVFEGHLLLLLAIFTVFAPALREEAEEAAVIAKIMAAVEPEAATLASGGAAGAWIFGCGLSVG